MTPQQIVSSGPFLWIPLRGSTTSTIKDLGCLCQANTRWRERTTSVEWKMGAWRSMILEGVSSITSQTGTGQLSPPMGRTRMVKKRGFHWILEMELGCTLKLRSYLARISSLSMGPTISLTRPSWSMILPIRLPVMCSLLSMTKSSLGGTANSNSFLRE